MNQIHKRLLSFLLAGVLGLGGALPAAASDALGHDLYATQVQVSLGTSLTKQVFWSDAYSDLRVERYFTYSPSEAVVPVVSYGAHLTDRETLTEMAAALEAQGRRLVGGVNGDLYVLSTGAPLGLVVSGSVLRSAPGSKDFGYYGVGFRADGTAFIGKPAISLTASFREKSFPIGGGLNKVREKAAGYVLYTQEFAPTTQHTSPGVDVILSVVEEDLGQVVETGSGPLTLSAAPAIGRRVVCRVEQILESAGELPLPEGKLVLSIHGGGDSYLLSELRALQVGDTVSIDATSPEQPWTEAVEAMGGFRKLVTAGQVETGLPTERTAYTAVGVRPNGSAVFYTIDGKQPGYSVGATLDQVARRLIELGCVDAVSLDGGGSTTLGATLPTQENLTVQNKPADGAQRANSVALFLESKASRTEFPGSYYVLPGSELVLAGGQVPMEATLLDTAYYPLSDLTHPLWQVESGGGSIDETGLYTAPAQGGVAVISASNSSVTGSATVTVVSQPDKILLFDEVTGAAVESLNLSPGEEIDLTASARWHTLAPAGVDTCFTWSMTGNAGTVDSAGRLTAAPASGSGVLTVSMGSASLSIPVSVAGHVKPVEDFEGGIDSLLPEGGAAVSWEEDDSRVRYGRRSLRLDYDFTLDGAFLTGDWPVEPQEQWLNLWVYGDGSGNTLSGFFENSLGGVQILPIATLDFTGWQYIQTALPAGTAIVRMISLTRSGDVEQGSVWLDQFTTSNEAISDLTPPSLTLSVSGGTIRATVTDLVDQRFPRKALSLTWDGSAMDFLWDEATGVLTAALPAGDGLLHHLSLTAQDASGNLARVSADLPPSGEREAVFADTAEHWAKQYALYLYDHGVTNGVPDELNGTLLFQPDKDLTRGEFFAMLGRWLGLDLTQYADVVLPFADADTIPDWALPGVKAMYALGYLKGSAEGELLFAHAASPISRSEAMALLGRIQPKGYSGAPLTFSDAASVPDWALPYVEILVEQKVVGGYEGRIMPTGLLKRGEISKMLFSLT